ncbi:MAG: TonB-dependent receptor [Alphaproteobacteria bacterium HGW-Alphaproteobacteria-14]|nr:MAG: TonB-dependent receptor [Alphaproteobacteria bacterium HGW-Alphaproteobacteria-14]
MIRFFNAERRVGLFASVGVAALAMSAPALAQDAETEEEAAVTTAETSEETAAEGVNEPVSLITVTGSRIRRPDLQSAVPVLAIEAEGLRRSGNFQLGDALNELPQLRGTFGSQNSGRFIGTAGLSLLDLRGLGTDRTLVLVNGRRHVTSTPGDFSVDTATIPTELLQRVDVVTGGNSAIYGSDAIAGVVNFILRNDYEGVSLNAQSGISDFGDRESYNFSGTAGRNFADGRGNIAVSAEYSRQRPLTFRERDNFGPFTGAPGFSTTDINFNEGPEGDGIPDTTFFNGQPFGLKFNQISENGAVLTTCPANLADPRRPFTCTGIRSPVTGAEFGDNFFFQPNGDLLRNNPFADLRGFGGGTLGGFGSSVNLPDGQLQVGIERYSFNALTKYEFSTAAEAFFEAKYVNVTANQASNQPTFTSGGGTTAVFSVNNPFLSDQARGVLANILPAGATAFQMLRFNADLGTRAEDHERETYRFVGGFRGQLSGPGSGNLSYEVAGNFGRTETFFETGGNLLTANFNRAANAVRNTEGNIVCGVNADANPNNDDPACVPINLFGFGAPSKEAADFVLFTSSRKQWAEQLNFTAFLSGDSSGLLELPGGPIGFALGGEYREEKAFSAFDPITASGQTFLNSAEPFDPPTFDVAEVFGEIRIPLLADLPFIKELTLEGAVRYSDYNISGGSTAYNFGGIYSPFEGLRIRGGYARSVRVPNLSDTFSPQSQTFANGLVDPCDQNVIRNVEFRVERCAEAGVPATVTLPDNSVVPFTNTAQSGTSGFNQGNPNLQPEIGKSFTLGLVFQPTFFPGFTASLDFYDIEVSQVISGLTGQAIINRCFEDPVTIDNPFCDAVFRRAPTGNVFTDFAFDGQTSRVFGGIEPQTFPSVGPAFLNQPFNFAALETSGIDARFNYARKLDADWALDLNLIVSWLEDRRQFTFITDPDRATQLRSTLGDPEWQFNLSAGVTYKNFTFIYEGRFIDRMLIGAFETQNSFQGRPPQNADAFPVKFFPEIYYSDIRLEWNSEEDFGFYFGVDNLFNQLPPFGQTGTGGGSSIYNNTGRFFFAGINVNF